MRIYVCRQLQNPEFASDTRRSGLEALARENAPLFDD